MYLSRNKTEIVQKEGKLILGPECQHGPSILFKRGSEKHFFACSANRSRKDCPFYKEVREDQINQFEVNSKFKKRKKSSQSKPGQIEEADESCALKKRRKLKVDSKDPSNVFQSGIEKNKSNAQFFCSETSTTFLCNLLIEESQLDPALDKSDLVQKLICIGMPSILAELGSRSTSISPHLLDIDPRFEELFPDRYTRYNLGNNFYFGDSENFDQFLDSKLSNTSNSYQIAIDPPFGMRLELVYNSVKCLLGRISKNSLISKDNVQLFLLNPYFMEGHIYKIFNKPDQPLTHLTMSDYRITYKTKFKSPETSTVRLFHSPWVNTNKAFELSEASSKKEYKFCKACQRFVFRVNKHCSKCSSCTTKHGKSVYKHCYKCRKCVKSSYEHSKTEGKCILKKLA